MRQPDGNGPQGLPCADPTAGRSGTLAAGSCTGTASQPPRHLPDRRVIPWQVAGAIALPETVPRDERVRGCGVPSEHPPPPAGLVGAVHERNWFYGRPPLGFYRATRLRPIGA